MAARRSDSAPRGARLARARSEAEPWYAARCVFKHTNLKALRRRKNVYEERIVLVRARSFDEAFRKAEREAKKYARGTAGITYIRFVEAYHLFGRRVGDGSEVFSLMRSSDLTSRAFVARYLRDGSEHRR
jgi:hypothetical protein